MNKQWMVFGLVVLFCISIVISKPLFYANQEPSPSPELSEQINYKATVCTTHTRADGVVLMHECSHNLLTTVGRNMIKNYIGLGNPNNVSFIAMCNASADCSTPAIGNTVVESEFVGAGLARARGNYRSNGNGNWSLWTTFTSTRPNVLTNMSGILNQTSAGGLFAINTFTLATLQTGDSLKINWTISCS